mgnify:FL=1
MVRTNNGAEYHRQRRIADPALYRERGREYAKRHREKKKQEKLALARESSGWVNEDPEIKVVIGPILDEAENQEVKRQKLIDEDILQMTIEDLAEMFVDTQDADPDQTPAENV